VQCALEAYVPAAATNGRCRAGAAICTTCAGFSQSFACSRCGLEDKLLAGRLCTRCTLADRLAELLDDGTGRIRPELVPLAELLLTMDNPRSGLSWLEVIIGQDPAEQRHPLVLGQWRRVPGGGGG
jgi:hypothetical protein